jgi:hypothetical protein
LTRNQKNVPERRLMAPLERQASKSFSQQDREAAGVRFSKFGLLALRFRRPRSICNETSVIPLFSCKNRGSKWNVTPSTNKGWRLLVGCCVRFSGLISDEKMEIESLKILACRRIAGLLRACAPRTPWWENVTVSESIIDILNPKDQWTRYGYILTENQHPSILSFATPQTAAFYSAP